MSELVIKDVCYPRKYTDKNGDEKTNWIKIGTSFEKEGRQNIEIYSLPVGVTEKLTICVFPKKDFNQPF